MNFQVLGLSRDYCFMLMRLADTVLLNIMTPALSSFLTFLRPPSLASVIAFARSHTLTRSDNTANLLAPPHFRARLCTSENLYPRNSAYSRAHDLAPSCLLTYGPQCLGVSTTPRLHGFVTPRLRVSASTRLRASTYSRQPSFPCLRLRLPHFPRFPCLHHYPCFPHCMRYHEIRR